MQNSFVSAVANHTQTTNGMAAHISSTDACLDLFYAVGASRGKDITSLFHAAMQQDAKLATRITLWARDVRGGAGERELFRQMLRHLSVTNLEFAERVLVKVPELGRWDDLLHVPAMRNQAFTLIAKALASGNGLCAKWMPRKGQTAVALTRFLGMTPKQYRKTLVTLTQVVETQMCAKEWDAINFEHVPSVAAARYRNAFQRNTEKYAEYTAKLVKGEAKAHASAVYPHQVLQGIRSSEGASLQFIEGQWNALPNYVGDRKILPMVDVSGSMGVPVAGSKNVTCMDVSVALGLYLADKNQGAYHGMFLTFSEQCTLQKLQGSSVVNKYYELKTADWGMSTNLERAMLEILSVATRGKVPQSDMPEYLLILSDMQFDMATRRGDTALEMARSAFRTAGYAMPKIVFWNLNSYSNVPVTADENGTALVSGFSPALLEAVLSCDLEGFTPRNVMLSAVGSPRYDF